MADGNRFTGPDRGTPREQITRTWNILKGKRKLWGGDRDQPPPPPPPPPDEPDVRIDINVNR